MPKRFVDDGRRIGYFSNNILVCCPNCNKNAVVIAKENKISSFKDNFIICKHCGLNKKVIESFRDWIKEDKLYLKVNSCGEVLWFLNKEHLLYMKSFIAADLRTHNRPSTSSLIARLPKWIKSSKNKEEILKDIEKLEKQHNNILSSE